MSKSTSILGVVLALTACGDDDSDAAYVPINTGGTHAGGSGGGGASSGGDSGSGGATGGAAGTLTIDDPLYRTWTDTMAEWITDDGYACRNEQSACGGLPCPSDDLWVAINETDFRNSAICSACMEVEGPLGTVTVEVIENCSSACVDGEIELSRTAFERIGHLGEGQADVRWRLVPCLRSGPIAFSYEQDSHDTWAGIQVRNPALPVASLSIRYSANEGWVTLHRDGWDHFPVSGQLGTGPFDFTITAIDGQELVEQGVAYVVGGVVQGTGQFNVSAP